MIAIISKILIGSMFTGVGLLVILFILLILGECSELVNDFILDYIGQIGTLIKVSILMYALPLLILLGMMILIP